MVVLAFSLLSPPTAGFVAQPHPIVRLPPPVPRGAAVCVFGQKKQKYRLALPGTSNKQGLFGRRKKRTWFRSQPAQRDLPGPITIVSSGLFIAAVWAVFTGAWTPTRRIRRDHGFANFPSAARFAPDGSLEKARTRAAATALLQGFRASSTVPSDSEQSVREAALAVGVARRSAARMLGLAASFLRALSLRLTHLGAMAGQLEFIEAPPRRQPALLVELQALQAAIRPASMARAMRMAATAAARRRRGGALEAREADAAGLLLLIRALVDGLGTLLGGWRPRPRVSSPRGSRAPPENVLLTLVVGRAAWCGAEAEEEAAAARSLFGFQGETARTERLALGAARSLVAAEVARILPAGLDAPLDGELHLGARRAALPSRALAAAPRLATARGPCRAPRQARCGSASTRCPRCWASRPPRCALPSLGTW
jgi:hypothetical protein